MSVLDEGNVTYNVNTKGKKQKTKSGCFAPGVERKTLHTLQLSADYTSLTRPGDQIQNKDGKDVTKPAAITSKKSVSIFEDPVQPTVNKVPKSSGGDGISSGHAESESESCTCQCHHISAEEQLYKFMTAEPDLEEWKTLAEERKNALEEALVENRQLHFEVTELKNQVSSLNEQVKEIKEERDYFAGVLQKVLSYEDDAADGAAASCTDETNSADSGPPSPSDVTQSP